MNYYELMEVAKIMNTTIISGEYIAIGKSVYYNDSTVIELDDLIEVAYITFDNEDNAQLYISDNVDIDERELYKHLNPIYTEIR